MGEGDLKTSGERPRVPLPDGYRSGIISAITVLIGFSLLFLRYWTFEADGDWTVVSFISALLLALSIFMQFFALWRSLQPRDDDEPVYRNTVRWFFASIFILVVGLLLAELTASRVIKY